MKNKIVFLMLMMLGIGVFAQEYAYTDPSYEQAARQVVALQQIEQFPEGFFNQAKQDNSTHNDRINLLSLAKQQYDNHQTVFAAAYNYGAVLLGENKIEEARNVLKQAVDMNSNNIDAYRLLTVAYERSIFGTEATYAQQERGEGLLKAQKRLEALERKIETKDPQLNAADYHEAGMICEKLGRHGEADMYYEMERNAGCENRD